MVCRTPLLLPATIDNLAYELSEFSLADSDDDADFNPGDGDPHGNMGRHDDRFDGSGEPASSPLLHSTDWAGCCCIGLCDESRCC
jgi:hypothetical protein